jgi:hypothetical protein
MEEDIAQCRQHIVSQLHEESRKHDSLLKLLSPDRKAKDDKNFKDIESELHSSESLIHRLKEELHTLDSGDEERIGLLIRRLNDRNSLGHHFKERQNYKPRDCAHCQDPLWGHRFLECSGECLVMLLQRLQMFSEEPGKKNQTKK